MNFGYFLLLPELLCILIILFRVIRCSTSDPPSDGSSTNDTDTNTNTNPTTLPSFLSSTTSTPRVSYHFRRPGEPITRGYAITCCAGGVPSVDEKFEKFLLNFSVSEQFDSVPTYSGDGNSCKRYNGNYILADDPEIYELSDKVSLMVRCQCPDPKMDRNCRILIPCQNGGYRSFSNKLRCVCPGRYFGELCEFWCSRGERRKMENGTDYCWCTSPFTGLTCSQPVCLNGGTPLNDRCICPAKYTGQHCERRLVYTMEHGGQFNREDGTGGDLRIGLSKGNGGVTGASLSILLIVVVLVFTYCLLRRRLKALSRRARMLNQIAARRTAVYAVFAEDGSRVQVPGAPLHTTNNTLAPPPSYSELMTSSQSGGNETIPLPSYEDALKHQVLMSSAQPHGPRANQGSANTDQVNSESLQRPSEVAHVPNDADNSNSVTRSDVNAVNNTGASSGETDNVCSRTTAV